MSSTISAPAPALPLAALNVEKLRRSGGIKCSSSSSSSKVAISRVTSGGDDAVGSPVSDTIKCKPQALKPSNQNPTPNLKSQTSNELFTGQCPAMKRPQLRLCVSAAMVCARQQYICFFHVERGYQYACCGFAFLGGFGYIQGSIATI